MQATVSPANCKSTPDAVLMASPNMDSDTEWSMTWQELSSARTIISFVIISSPRYSLWKICLLTNYTCVKRRVQIAKITRLIWNPTLPPWKHSVVENRFFAAKETSSPQFGKTKKMLLSSALSAKLLEITQCEESRETAPSSKYPRFLLLHSTTTTWAASTEATRCGNITTFLVAERSGGGTCSGSEWMWALIMLIFWCRWPQTTQIWACFHFAFRWKGFWHISARANAMHSSEQLTESTGLLQCRKAGAKDAWRIGRQHFVVWIVWKESLLGVLQEPHGRRPVRTLARISNARVRTFQDKTCGFLNFIHSILTLVSSPIYVYFLFCQRSELTGVIVRKNDTDQKETNGKHGVEWKLTFWVRFVL